MRRSAPALGFLLAAGLAGGCKAAPEEKAGPVLEAEWSGSDSGKVRGSASAEWCASLHLLEVRALRGDTGIAIAIYPRDQFRPGRYPVMPPSEADSVPPAAAVGLRWFAETSIRGFQGDSGSVVVEESPPGVYSGVIEANAHSVTDGGHIVVRGSFSRLVVRPGARACVARKPTPDSGAGVH